MECNVTISIFIINKIIWKKLAKNIIKNKNKKCSLDKKSCLEIFIKNIKRIIECDQLIIKKIIKIN